MALIENQKAAPQLKAEASRRKATPTQAAKSLKVCALAYDGLCTFEFGIVVEVFALARPELPVDWYRFAIAAIEPGPLAAVGGYSISVDADLSALQDADLIIVPGWRGADQPVPKSLIVALRQAHDRGARLASICSGAFVLAATGLLNGARATTHWRYAAQLQHMYPAIEVAPDVLYVDEGQILTSAGSAAGLDMCLHIVRADYGPQIGNEVARRLVVPAHREGGQAQFVPRPVAREAGGAIAPLMDQIRATVNEEWDVARMAKISGLSPRTLLRRFNDATGLSPNAWLVEQRLAHARHLLECSQHGVKTIAELCGFGAPETLRHHFRRAIGTSPAAYRRAFRD